MPDLIQWLQSNPDAIGQLVDFYNQWQDAVARIVAPAGPAVAGSKILPAGSNVVIQIPIQFSASIPPVASGGTTDANCRATVSALLTALSRVGINP